MYVRSIGYGLARYRPPSSRLAMPDRGRGLGASTSLFDRTPGSSGHGSCSALYWNFNPLALLDPDCKAPSASGLPAPPVPPPPGVTLTVGPQPSPDAVYSGTDASGATIWATPQTPDAAWQAYRDSLLTFYSGLDSSNQQACMARGYVWDASGVCSAPPSFFDKYGALMLAGGVLFGGLVLFKAVTR